MAESGCCRWLATHQCAAFEAPRVAIFLFLARFLFCHGASLSLLPSAKGGRRDGRVLRDQHRATARVVHAVHTGTQPAPAMCACAHSRLTLASYASFLSRLPQRWLKQSPQLARDPDARWQCPKCNGGVCPCPGCRRSRRQPALWAGESPALRAACRLSRTADAVAQRPVQTPPRMQGTTMVRTTLPLSNPRD